MGGLFLDMIATNFGVSLTAIYDIRQGRTWSNMTTGCKFPSIPSRRKKAASGHKYIYWVDKQNKWKVLITIKEQTLRIGRFSDLNEAIKARDIALDKLKCNATT